MGGRSLMRSLARPILTWLLGCKSCQNWTISPHQADCVLAQVTLQLAVRLGRIIRGLQVLADPPMPGKFLQLSAAIVDSSGLLGVMPSNPNLFDWNVTLVNQQCALLTCLRRAASNAHKDYESGQ